MVAAPLFRFGAVAVLLWSAACGGDGALDGGALPSRDGGLSEMDLGAPRDASEVLSDVGDGGADVGVDGGAEHRDPMTFLGLPEGAPADIVEAVEVRVDGNRIGMCSGLGGLDLYEARPLRPPVFLRRILPAVGPTLAVRCQHLAFRGSRALVSHRGDILIPEPYLALVDLATGTTATAAVGGASYEGVEVVGSRAYVAQHGSGLSVWSLAAGSLRPVGVVTTGLENAWMPRASADGRFLFVADATRGLVIFDLSDPDRPRYRARVPSAGTVKDLVLADDRAYLASGVAGVEWVDVSDPTEPRLVGSVDTLGSTLGVSVGPGFLLAADWTSVRIFARENPDQLTPLGHQKAFSIRSEPDPASRVLDVDTIGSQAFFAEWTGLEAHVVDPAGRAPDLFVEPQVRLPRGSIADPPLLGVRVWNLGPEPLAVSDVRAPMPFGATPRQFDVAPGRSHLLALEAPFGIAQFVEADIEIESNDVDEPRSLIRARVDPEGIQPGDPAPDVLFESLAGERRRLSSFRGQPVLLAYFATF